MAQARCDTCGRALTADQAGGLICPSCGRAAVIPSDVIAATAQTTDDSTTRPVPEFAQALAERPTAPPPPPLDPQTAPAMPYPGEYVPPALPRSGGVPAVAASAAPPAGASAGTGRRAGRGGIASAISLLVLLLIVASGAVMLANGKLGNLLGGGGTTSVATPTSAATATTPSGFRLFTSPDGVYRLSYPSTWNPAQQTTSDETFALFSDVSTQANFEINVWNNPQDPGSKADQFVSALGGPHGLASPDGSAMISDSQTLTEIPLRNTGNTLWTHKVATITVTRANQTVAWHVEMLAAQHGQNTVLVAYFAPAAVFASENATHFTPMVNSLALS